MSAAFTVPSQPTSVNRTYNSNGSRRFKSTQVKSYETMVSVYAQQAWRGRAKLLGPVGVRLRFFFRSDRADIDNPVKTVLDAMAGFVFLNDKQVRLLFVTKDVDQKNPRVEIRVGSAPEIIRDIAAEMACDDRGKSEAFLIRTHELED